MFLLFAACSIFAPPCDQLTLEICDACPLDDFSELACICLEEGTLVPNDFPDGYDVGQDEAAYFCDSQHWYSVFSDHETDNYCRAQLRLIREYPALTCEYMGYSDDDTSYTSYE